MNKKNIEVEGQMDLIDIHPRQAKPIIKAARIYKQLVTARKAALQEEVEQKHKVLELIKAAKLQPLESGVIKFRCDGVIVSVTPRDELVQVKEENGKSH